MDDNNTDSNFIEAVYESEDLVPEAYKSLYAEKNGKYVLSGVRGVLLEEDHSKLRSALTSERRLRTDAESRLKNFDGVDVVKLKELETRVPELEQALEAANKDRRTAIDAAVAERINPLERNYKVQIEALNSELTKEREKAVSLQNTIKKRDFDEAVINLAGSSGILPSALVDFVRRATEYGWQLDENRELVALRPDGTPRYSLRRPADQITFDEWVRDVLATEASHLFKPSTGGDASGGGSKGPMRRKRSEMSVADKSEFIGKFGMKAFTELPA